MVQNRFASTKPKSNHRHVSIFRAEDDQQDDYLVNIYSSIIQQTLLPSYPTIFDPSVFSYEALVWADLVCQVHSVHTESDKVTIIPM